MQRPELVVGLLGAALLGSAPAQAQSQAAPVEDRVVVVFDGEGYPLPSVDGSPWAKRRAPGTLSAHWRTQGEVARSSEVTASLKMVAGNLCRSQPQLATFAVVGVMEGQAEITSTRWFRCQGNQVLNHQAPSGLRATGQSLSALHANLREEWDDDEATELVVRAEAYRLTRMAGCVSMQGLLRDELQIDAAYAVCPQHPLDADLALIQRLNQPLGRSVERFFSRASRRAVASALLASSDATHGGEYSARKVDLLPDKNAKGPDPLRLKLSCAEVLRLGAKGRLRLGASMVWDDQPVDVCE